MARKRFPVYVVRSQNGGCGHQHVDQINARNCALAEMRKHPTLSYADVIRIRLHATHRDTVENTMETIRREDISNQLTGDAV